MDEYPSSQQIDPERAKYLYENLCAIFILENLPQGSEFGIDMVAYRTGEKFKGIKLIPPGVHFVYASSVDKNNRPTLGPRCGFFHEFKPKEVLIKRWSIIEEDFDDSLRLDDEYIERYSNNLRDLDRFLGPYDFSTYRLYKSLTHKLTPELIRELMPQCGRLRSVPYLTRQSNNDGIVAVGLKQRIPRRVSVDPSRPTEDTLMPDLKPEPETVIHFTRIPNDHLSANQTMTRDQITQYNLDTSFKLEHCFPDQEGKTKLLAELEFSFVSFLLCHIYECFEHWKTILRLICLVDSGIAQIPTDFFMDFIEILTHQVSQISVDLFEDIVDSNNLIRHHIDIFVQNIENHSQAGNDLKKAASDLKGLLEDKFGWQFGLEEDEDQPVVVEL